jgi:homoserine kinase type II
MALLTELRLSEAQRLASAYGLRLKSVTALAAGSVNSNFFLDTEDGQRFFGRLYEEQGLSGAQFEVRLNLALSSAGVPVARPLVTLGGEPCVIYGRPDGREQPFSLYEHVEGEVVCQKRVTQGLAHSVGAALARVHRAPLSGLSVPDGRFTIDALRMRLRRVHDSGRASLLPDAERIDELLAEIDKKRARDLPTGLIHGDLFRDNTLVSGESVLALLDFESACRGPFLYDLIVTILAFCYGDSLDQSLVASMVRGYASVRALGARELEEIETEGRLVCARFAVTRLTDFSLRVPEGEKPLRDYRRFLERKQAIEAGELRRAFETGLGSGA